MLATSGTSWGRLALGADFRPGTEVVVRAPASVTVSEILTTARNRIPGEWKAQTVGTTGDGPRTYRLSTPAIKLAVVRREVAAGPGTSSGQPGASNQDPLSLLGSDLRALGSEKSGPVELLSAVEVGPTITTQRLRVIAIFVAASICAVVLYTVWTLRVGGFCALGLFMASLHDVLAMLAVLALLGLPLTYAVVGAILTVVGYSVNDSIILLVRIKQVRKDPHVQGAQAPVEVVSSAIDACFGRTVTTSITTAVPMAILCFAGGEALRDFAVTVTAGVVAGTLSTFFIVGPFALRSYARRPRPEPAPQALTAREFEALLDQPRGR
jgi:preprotein translocase SecF subunit